MGQHDADLDQSLAAVQILHRAQRLTEADQAYSNLLSRWPDASKALALHGALKIQMQRPTEAIALMARSLALSADQPETRTNLGYALFLLRRYDDALRELDGALQSAPTYATAHNHRGLVLAATGQINEALACFEHALVLQPDHGDATINRANMLHKLGRSEEALESYILATELQPRNALAHFSLGRALAAESRPLEAISSYDRALALQPDYPEALWAKGVTKLLLGDYREGWALYEARWRAPSFGHAPRHFPKPVWDGSALSGKTILIHAEQGFGDTIQFCRYIPLLAAHGARVLCIAQPELIGLLRASPLPCDVFMPGDKVPMFDVHCALLSLPHLFATTLETVPHNVPYITPPADKMLRWTALLGERRKPRIGLAWSGRRTHIDDQRRSITVDTLAPLLDLDAEFHCLQTEITDVDREALGASGKIREFTLENRDFGDAAAHIAAMDIVITVDTSLAHLAGAMGKPVWIMLAHKPDFRWMLDRADSPWHPTARLMRQSRKDDWSDVIVRAAADLREKIS